MTTRAHPQKARRAHGSSLTSRTRNGVDFVNFPKKPLLKFSAQALGAPLLLGSLSPDQNCSAELPGNYTVSMIGPMVTL